MRRVGQDCYLELRPRSAVALRLQGLAGRREEQQASRWLSVRFLHARLPTAAIGSMAFWRNESMQKALLNGVCRSRWPRLDGK